MTKSLLTVLLVLGTFACTHPTEGGGQPANAGGGTAEATSGACASGTYAADVNGAQAIARVTYEVLIERTVIAGDITSATARYIFNGDLYGDRGWVDVVTEGSNERFRAQIDVIPQGFVFTANAYEGAGSTAYTFTCR